MWKNLQKQSYKTTTKFLRMMMDTRTNSTNRAKKLLKLLNRLIKQEHLYSEEEIKEYKKNIKVIKDEIDRIDSQTFKGFGKKWA